MTEQKAKLELRRCAYCARGKRGADLMCRVHWGQFRRWMRLNLWERWMVWRTGTSQDRMVLLKAWRRGRRVAEAASE